MTIKGRNIAVIVLVIVIFVLLFTMNFLVLSGKFSTQGDETRESEERTEPVESEKTVETKPEKQTERATERETEKQTEKQTEKETEIIVEPVTERETIDTSKYIEDPENLKATSYPTQVKASATVPDSYFDDALFVGDSRMLDFCTRTGVPNGYTAVSLGVYSAPKSEVINIIVDRKVKTVTIAEAIEYNKDKFKKIYIGLGINDYAATPENFVAALAKFVEQVQKAANPGTVIYVESILPVNERKAEENGYHCTNEKVKGINDAVAAACPDMGVYFVNCAEAIIKDNVFGIDYEVTNDGLHFNGTEYRKVKAYLASHTVG